MQRRSWRREIWNSGRLGEPRFIRSDDTACGIAVVVACPYSLTRVPVNNINVFIAVSEDESEVTRQYRRASGLVQTAFEEIRISPHEEIPARLRRQG